MRVCLTYAESSAWPLLAIQGVNFIAFSVLSSQSQQFETNAHRNWNIVKNKKTKHNSLHFVCHKLQGKQILIEALVNLIA
jgi:hypothetical protein